MISGDGRIDLLRLPALLVEAVEGGEGDPPAGKVIRRGVAAGAQEERSAALEQGHGLAGDQAGPGRAQPDHVDERLPLHPSILAPRGPPGQRIIFRVS